MPKIKVSLSIGYPAATREDVIEIDDNDWNDCLNKDQREELMQECWNEWAWNYIDGGQEIITELNSETTNDED